MGRHADPDPGHFWRSLAVAGLRATAALALVAGLFAALSVVGQPTEDGPAMLGGPDDSEEQDVPPPTPEPTATEGGAVDNTDTDTDTDTGDTDAGGPNAGDTDADALLAAAPPPGDTTVQVLDAVGDPASLDRLVARLQEHGYVIVATNPAGTGYSATTVLYTEGNEPAARALQAREPRIVERRPNPGLSTEVDLHVVLGADWRP